MRVSQKASAKKTLYLHQGGVYVERAEWSFRLGDVLVRRGTISREQLEQSLAQQKTTGARLGDTLVELGFTTNENVLAARRLQVEEEIYDLFAWDDAVYEFEKDQFPDGFEGRLTDPEEFRFDVRSILMEAARRLDEWKRIHEHVPSLKRLYVLSEKATEQGTKAVQKAFKEVKVAAAPEVFDGKRTVEELVRVLGLSHFETLSCLARFASQGWVRPLQRHELEARLRVAVEEDLPYALKLYEAALETPEFEQRGKYLDRAIFGSPKFREFSQKQSVALTARMRGKRALELLLSLLRQGITCELSATEEGRTLGLGFSKSALVWRGKDRETQPNIVRHLLDRSPIAAADMARVEEMQKTTGRTLQQILVGGGYVTMDNWFRAQKDTVLNEIFDLFFWKRPYVEVRTGADRERGAAGQRVGLDIDVPMLPWLREEISEEIKRWEAIIAAIPSVRGFFVLSPKGQKQAKGPFDLLTLFDGRRPLEEVMRAQKDRPQTFFFWLHEQVSSGRVEPLSEDDYRKRLDAALQNGKRKEAIDYCIAAIDSGIQVRYFHDRLKELEIAEQATEAQASRPTLRGGLKSFSLAEVLQSFFIGKRSGTLRIFDERRSREIYFVEGNVFLLLEGAETAELSVRGGAPAPIPTGMGGESLAETLAEQMKDELYEVFLWETAEFEFTADVLPAIFYNDGLSSWRVKLNTSQFLMEAVRRIAEWEEVRAVIPHDDMKLSFTSPDAKMASIQHRVSERSKRSHTVVHSIASSSSSDMLVNGDDSTWLSSQEASEFRGFHILRGLSITAGLNACIRIEKEVAGMSDLGEVLKPLCYRSFVGKDLIAIDSQEAGQKFKVRFFPQRAVCEHRIHRKIPQQLLALEELEERTFPVIQSVAQIFKIQWLLLRFRSLEQRRFYGMPGRNPAPRRVCPHESQSRLACKLRYE